ncbi:outer membrane lipoprotein-sorting protein [Aggregatimonas sangjinii]|uniref:Outer membrane lipoprotein-sorting protein n=1 Tax=Aggregatimonas sangjinii TaxID=2583587 RepID=A0A5B7ST96_9FLAO|nr:outer membrane lipoprotein-sorting protein [Aggregatimonas sangjinii]QCX00080.1 outer membrane lipoprotein-sorting protein [Aggregatimonas sangjinii]
MKTVKIFIALFAFAILAPAQAQTADEIISSYLENIGGVEKWKALEGMKMTAKLNQMGMELPLEIYRMGDGRTTTIITVQGMTLKDETFDGETLWGSNQMTMQPEKKDAETTANFKLDLNDYPNDFIDYKDKGYVAELVGKESFDGTETFKIKLTKEPHTVDGKEVQDVTFYFFDTENFVPIGISEEVKNGPAKGMVQKISFSDYQEVEGLYFPYSWNIGVEGQPQTAPLMIEEIELNPTVDDSLFAFPEAAATEDKN